MSLGPMVSCVLPTGGRAQFLRQALRCYRSQQYPHRELIVIDDGAKSFEAELPPDPSIRYLRLASRMPLGAKLNLAIEHSQGEVIQKLDDDDYYRPEFIGRMVQALAQRESDQAIAALDCFVVLIASTGYLAYSGHGWVAGNSLCFSRELWKRRGFRSVDRGEDWWFLRDHSNAIVRVCEPELVVVVRHELGHTWTQCDAGSVTDHFRRCRAHHRSLATIVSREALEYYQSLRRPRDSSSKVALATD